MENTLKAHGHPSSSGLKNIFRSLKYRNYRLFFSGQSISLIGSWIQAIAIPWLVYSLTDSVFLLGIVGFAGQIPTFIISPFAGVLVDRWNRHTTLIVTQFLAMFQALMLAFLYFYSSIEIWQIVSLSIFLGCVNAFDMPARESLVVDMVEKKEDIGNAVALNSSMINGARLIGPSVAGILISLTGEGICFLINGLSYIFVILFLFMMRLKPHEIKSKPKKVIKELKEGFKYTFGILPIRYIILMLALVSLMGMPFSVLMPVFAKTVFHGGPHTFGFLMGASGTGALIGALYMASRKNVPGLIKIIPLYGAIFGLALVGFSFSRFFPLSLILILVSGVGMIIQMTSSNTLLQNLADEDKRGRVMSFYTMAFIGIIPFGSLLAGTLADHIGAPYTLLLCGVSILIGSGIFARKLPVLRKHIQQIFARLGVGQNDATLNSDNAELH